MIEGILVAGRGKFDSDLGQTLIEKVDLKEMRIQFER